MHVVVALISQVSLGQISLRRMFLIFSDVVCQDNYNDAIKIRESADFSPSSHLHCVDDAAEALVPQQCMIGHWDDNRTLVGHFVISKSLQGR